VREDQRRVTTSRQHRHRAEDESIHGAAFSVS